ncbi:hypothetical protein [Dyadobacter sp. CY343]|uniref:hypothetical protein n=1 Tax=Dyadobacter sp. CY343 TaxID=2907299 RepID=UPI001F2EAE34|nr:hypothetical protein [Dyadobacter sp. CY343]MCE7062353.1 hypothetical protein [Dyadobacter sp. CY343]
MGDTIGGTLGPIINLFAMVYIYKTYQDQKSALAIQAAALEHGRESSRDQMSISLNSELAAGLKEVEIMFENITYTLIWNLQDHNGNQMTRSYRGKDALDKFPQLRNLANFFEELSEADNNFLTSVLLVYARLEAISNQHRDLRPFLNDLHANGFNRRISTVGRHFVNPIDNIFRTLTIFGEMFPPQNQDNELNMIANRTFRLILQYQQISDSLEANGHKTRLVQAQEIGNPVFNFNPQILIDEETRNSINWDLEYVHEN